MGAAVAGYSLSPPTEPSFFNAVRLQMWWPGMLDDILHRRRLRGRRLPPSLACCSLRGRAAGRRGVCQPDETFTTNVLGTLNVLGAVGAASSL